MRVIAEENWAWMLFSEGEDYFLSIVCGITGIFTRDIRLETSEIGKYQDGGSGYIAALAKAVAASPSDFLSRHIPDFDNFEGVKGATESWRITNAEIASQPRISSARHMASEEQLHSWTRTESYLRDARSHVSEIAEDEFGDALLEAESYLSHNELGLAFDVLRAVAEESNWESQHVFELLALAAASMGLEKEQRELDSTLSKLKGWAYETKLPEKNA